MSDKTETKIKKDIVKQKTKTAFKKRKIPKIGERIEVKVECECNGNCVDIVRNKKLNNFTVDVCRKNTHLLAFTKEFDV